MSYVAYVVDSFVEASAKFWRDGLDGNSFIGDSGEDDEELRRRLRCVGLVHGDFRDEVSLPFCGFDFAVDFACFLYGEEKLFGGSAKLIWRDGYGFVCAF